MSQGRLKRVPVNIHIALLFPLERDRKKERVGEKIKHLLKSLILPTLEVLSCMLSFRKRASKVSIATTNRTREPVGHKTALKGPCNQHGSENSTGVAGQLLSSTVGSRNRPQR